METVIAWIVAIMVTVSPFNRTTFIPEAQETLEQKQARYDAIAKDLIEVVFSETEKPMFGGKRGRINTMILMLAVSSMESGFRRDVDFGLGKAGKGDQGKSWCLMQVNIGVAQANGKTKTRIVVDEEGRHSFTTDPNAGWGGEDLVTDRKACFRAGLAILRASFRSCSASPMKDRLAVYASGNCAKGLKESRTRMGVFSRWSSAKKPEFKDSDVVEWLKPTIPAPVEPAPSNETEKIPQAVSLLGI